MPETYVLSEAKCWTFNEDLRVEPFGGEAPKNINVKDIHEEGLETLLWLNLDRIWGGWHLRSCAKSPKAWGGADIDALDPLNCLHLFEVKYGSSLSELSEQIVSYALGALVPRHGLVDDPVGLLQVFIACRIEGFWVRERSDKHQRQTELPLLERDRQVLVALSATDAQFERVLEYGATHANRLRSSNGGATIAKAVHMHIVIPSVAKLPKPTLRVIENLLARNTGLSVWEAGVCIDGDTRTGVLVVRHVEFPAANMNYCAISDFGGRKLLNAVALQDDTLSGLRIFSSPRNGEVRFCSEDLVGIHASLREIRELDSENEEPVRVRATLTLLVEIAQWARRSSDHRQHVESLLGISGRWLSALAPPEDPGTLSSLSQGRRRRIDWTTQVDCLELTCSRSSGLCEATITGPPYNHGEQPADVVAFLAKAFAGLAREVQASRVVIGN